MDKWEASFISVLSQVGASAIIIASVSPPLSLCLAKLSPCVSLCTEGNNNTPPNPPLTALLTQSIPHGVERWQFVVAKLWLLWQRGLRFSAISARCGVAIWALTRKTLVGDNEQDSAVMVMTLFVYEVIEGRLPISLECVRETVSRWVGVGNLPPWGLLFMLCVNKCASLKYATKTNKKKIFIIKQHTQIFNWTTFDDVSKLSQLSISV